LEPRLDVDGVTYQGVGGVARSPHLSDNGFSGVDPDTQSRPLRVIGHELIHSPLRFEGRGGGDRLRAAPAEGVDPRPRSAAEVVSGDSH
jgi:hypothetical protein